MKTFLSYISEGGKTKKVRRYKGTPVVIDSHGTHTQKKSPRYKGTPAVVDSHGSHAQDKTPDKKRLDEKREEPNSGVKPKNYSWSDEWEKANDNSQLGESTYHVDKHLTSTYPHDHFREEHNSAVKQYTEWSHKLNHHLINSYQDGKDPGETFEKHNIRHLDDVLHERHLKHDLHVYSGVGFHPGEEAAKDPENKLHLPAYTSTSVHKTTAFQFTKSQPDNNGERHNHLLHIHLKPGQKGNYFGHRAAFGNEYEFLLPRNTTLKLHPKPSVLPPGTHHTNGHPTYIWHAHVVPNEEADPRQMPLNLGKR
jgi:hypothetical protein